MLIHQKMLRQRILRMAVSTVIVGVAFLTVLGLATLSWVTSSGVEHTKILETMAMYTRVVNAESEIVIPDKYTQVYYEDLRKSDLFLKKVAAVRVFFQKYNAPLQSHAEDFVRAADMYGLDYRLLPAISMIESSGGKHLFKSYNPFGWGRSGYPSFTAAIYDVSRGMANYYASGLRDPKKIAYRYNPVTPESWGNKATRFMSEMPKL